MTNGRGCVEGGPVAPVGAAPAVLRLAPHRSEIAHVDAWWSGAAAAAAMPADVAEELRVCLHELLGNVVMHGGPDVSAMAVSASALPGRILVTVEDDGRPFDPTGQPEPPVPGSVNEASIGGLGLLLVRRFTDEFHYRRLGCRNCVTLGRQYTRLPA